MGSHVVESWVGDTCVNNFYWGWELGLQRKGKLCGIGMYNLKSQVCDTYV